MSPWSAPGSAQVPANRKPATTAAASRIVMLPPHSSGKQSTIRGPNSSGPDNQKRTASSTIVQATTNAVQGSARNGVIAWRNAGE